MCIKEGLVGMVSYSFYLMFQLLGIQFSTQFRTFYHRHARYFVSIVLNTSNHRQLLIHHICNLVPQRTLHLSCQFIAQILLDGFGHCVGQGKDETVIFRVTHQVQQLVVVVFFQCHLYLYLAATSIFRIGVFCLDISRCVFYARIPKTIVIVLQLVIKNGLFVKEHRRGYVIQQPLLIPTREVLFRSLGHKAVHNIFESHNVFHSVELKRHSRPENYTVYLVAVVVHQFLKLFNVLIPA